MNKKSRGLFHIKKIFRDDETNKAVVKCDFTESSDEEQRDGMIWFSTDLEYRDKLCTDVCDAYVIGIIGYCMRKGLDIKSDIPITNTLQHNLSEQLLPMLSKSSDSLYCPLLLIESIPESGVKAGNAIGTGASCGVDSMHAIWHYANHPDSDFRLTHLCINNVGAFNSIYDDPKKVKEKSYMRATELAKELNLPIICTDSNFATVIKQSHLATNTFSTCFAIYMLRYLWKQYYLASLGQGPSGITMNDPLGDSAQFEAISLPLLSTNKLRIYSDGLDTTRFDKIMDISNFKMAQKYLYSCTKTDKNCGTCPKCLMNMWCLDSISKLDKFTDVYDVEKYKQNRLQKMIQFLECKPDDHHQVYHKQTQKTFQDKNDPDYINAVKIESEIKRAIAIFYNKGEDQKQKGCFDVFKKFCDVSYIAKRHYALCLYHGLGVKQDIPLAGEILKQLRKENELNGGSGRFILLYIDAMIKTGDPEDIKDAFNLSKYHAIRKGNGAQYRLGKMYFEGIGVTKNVEIGMKWILEAANNGSNEAKEFLNNMSLSASNST